MAKDAARIINNSLERVLKIEGEVQNSMQKVVNRFNRNIERNISDLELENLENISMAYENTAMMLEDAGYFKEVGTMLNEKRQDILEQSFLQYKELFNKAFKFAPASMDILQAIKEVDALRFSSMAKNITDTISGRILEMQFDPSISKKKIRDEILNSLDVGVIKGDLNTFVNQLETEIITRTSGFYSSANVRLAQDNGMTRFRYSGNIIKTTRPFCEKYLNKVKTIEEWDDLWDDPLRKSKLLPVHIWRGGYNCRHTLSAVA